MLSVFVGFRIVHQNAQYELLSIFKFLSLVARRINGGLQYQVPPRSQPRFANEGGSHTAQDGQEGAMLLGTWRNLTLVQGVEVLVEALGVVIVDVVIALEEILDGGAELVG